MQKRLQRWGKFDVVTITNKGGADGPDQIQI